MNPLAAVPQEEEEVDDEEMGVAETYADYMPRKCKHIYKYFSIINWNFYFNFC